MFANILQIIETQSGTVLKDGRLERAKQFVSDALEAGWTPLQLIEGLSSKPFSDPLWQEAISQITVGETYFFRNRGHFDALRNHVLPALIRERRKANKLFLRIWVAGCATGEEAYSMAMLLHELIPDIENWSIFLLATDINQAFLENARWGLYRERSFRNETPNYIQGRWFAQEGPRFAVSSVLKRMVTFGTLNLVEEAYPAISNNTTRLDLIMCRNVTIYFSRETTQMIADRFYQALVPGGWLLIGHSEPQPRVYDQFQNHNINGAILYQRAINQVQPKPQPKPVVVPKVEPVAVPKMTMPAVTKPEHIATPHTVATPELTVVDLLDQARQAVDLEQWDAARDLLDTIQDDAPMHPMLHYLRGMIFVSHGTVDKALGAFQRSVYCDPGFALAYFALGELLSQLGKQREAIANWRRARKALRGQPNRALVQGTADMTVEELSDILTFRLS